MPAPAPIAASPVDQFKFAFDMLRSARRPVVVLGLEARRHAPDVLALVEALGCPVLPTYKAKGVVPDRHPQVAGVFTGGALEQGCVRQADLIVLIGVDPVELILQPWPYELPVIDIGPLAYPVHYLQPTAGVYGPIGETLPALMETGLPRSTWQADEIAQLRANAFRSLAYGTVSNGMAPDRVVQLAADACAEANWSPRISVDAGAHMFSATSFFPCDRPGDCLISNGLASMAFGLPAAIAASLEDPERPVICFTGDGGLMMCMGELCTAVHAGARIVVIVFNDGALSLIDIKQQSRQLPSRGVRWGRHDFARVMQGAGGLGLRARTERELQAALKSAIAAEAPALIDVQVDPGGYASQLKAMRG